MRNSPDILNRINKSWGLFFSLNRFVVQNKQLSIDTWWRIYVAIIINIALWGCKSLNLTAKDQRVLEVFHTWCCQRILGINIYDVISNHKFTNKYVLQEVRINHMNSFIELRQTRWVKKIGTYGFKQGTKSTTMYVVTIPKKKW